MRIIIDIRLLGRGEYSGVAEYTRQVISHLISQAPQHHFSFFYNSWNTLLPLPSQWTKAANVSVINGRVPNRLFRFLPIYPDTHQPTDLVYSPHTDHLRRRTSRILTIHDLSFVYYPHFFTRRQRFWHWLQSIASQTSRAQHIVTLSHYTKQTIHETLNVPEEKMLLYKQAAAFIYPSFFEGFGFPPLEAQTNGCPVIASNRASLIETLGDSAILINPWHTRQLADAIDHLLNNTTDRQRLVAAGFANSKRFSWHQCADRLLKVFSSCA